MIHALAVTMLLAAAGAVATAAPGVETLAFEEGGSTVSLIRFDLQRFRPEVVLLGPDHTKTAAALRRDLSAVAAINGGFFDERSPLAGPAHRGRQDRGPAAARECDWGVLVVRPGRASIVHSREFKPDARIEGAIQVGPRLVAAGQPLRLKPQSARRSAVALDREGRTLTLVVSPGPIDAGRLAERLAGLGFHSALLLDGGASTQVSAAAGTFTLDVAGVYGVPDALVVRSR
jgi:uncharacterized protein YigE (DUF2233 family)